MRFEFQKIDTDYLLRRAEQEEAKDPNKRLVTRIVLTPSEWAEFLLSQDCLRYNLGDLPRVWRIPVRLPISLAAFADAIGPTSIRTIEVVRG